jgi:hypothetical protein
MPALRYVVLLHRQIDLPHYDLMVELTPGSDLATWRIAHWPPEANDDFTPLPLHRRHYLEYEGPISGDRGQVLRVASGTHSILENSPSRLLICLEDGRRVELPKA